jgi:hypothetical protein
VKSRTSVSSSNKGSDDEEVSQEKTLEDEQQELLEQHFKDFDCEAPQCVVYEHTMIVDTTGDSIDFYFHYCPYYGFNHKEWQLEQLYNYPEVEPPAFFPPIPGLAKGMKVEVKIRDDHEEEKERIALLEFGEVEEDVVNPIQFETLDVPFKWVKGEILDVELVDRYDGVCYTVRADSKDAGGLPKTEILTSCFADRFRVLVTRDRLKLKTLLSQDEKGERCFADEETAWGFHTARAMLGLSAEAAVKRRSEDLAKLREAGIEPINFREKQTRVRKAWREEVGPPKWQVVRAKIDEEKAKLAEQGLPIPGEPVEEEAKEAKEGEGAKQVGEGGKKERAKEDKEDRGDGEDGDEDDEDDDEDDDGEDEDE